MNAARPLRHALTALLLGALALATPLLVTAPAEAAGVSIGPVSMVRTGESTARALAFVTPATGHSAQTGIEIGTDPDHSDAVRYYGEWMPAGNPGATARVDFSGLEPDTVYYYRYLVQDYDADFNFTEVFSDWQTYDTGTAPLVSSTAFYQYDTTAVLDVTVDPGAGEQRVFAEYAGSYGNAAPRRTEAVVLPAGAGTSVQRLQFTDVDQLDYYVVQVVMTDADGKETFRQELSKGLYLPGTRPETQIQRISDIQGRNAHVQGLVGPGTWGPQRTHLEYTADPTLSTITRTTPEEHADNATLEYELSGLEPGRRYQARIVAVATVDGLVTASDWTRFTTDAAPGALDTPRVSTLTQHGATVSVRVSPGDFTRAVHLEYTDRPDLTGTVSTTATRVAAGADPTPVDFPLTGLTTGTPYWARVVSTIGTTRETSEWLRFVTVPLPAATFTTVLDRPVAMRRGELSLTVTGLAPDEHWEARLDGALLTSGRADQSGAALVTARVPASVATGTRTLTITTDDPSRRGSATLRVLGPKHLRLALAKQHPRPGAKVRYTVRGLAAGEPVTVRYAGRRISPIGSLADANGTFQGRLQVGRTEGAAALTVRGLGRARSAATKVVVAG
jgi:hypothetical protein